MHRSTTDESTALRDKISSCLTRIMFRITKTTYMMLGCILIAKLWHCIVKLNGLFGFEHPKQQCVDAYTLA